MTAARAAPTVAAIVPAFNAASTIGACLAALAALRPPPDEIIVFNDGATDATPAIAREAGVRVLGHAGAPLGPAHGRNVAAAAADADLLLFVDADVLVAPDALARLAAAMAGRAAEAAFGSYDDRPLSRRVPSLYANLRHHFVHQHSAREASTFWSGLGLIDRRVFLCLGGFDAARFPTPSIEDVELGARMVAAGYRIRLVPEAKGKHCKDWRLTQLWRTDIARRAYPWSCLIADGRTAGRDLNLSATERGRAAVALAMLAVLPLGLASVGWLWAGLLLTLAYLALNRAFFGFLARRLPPLALVQAVAMHWGYHVYASATFAAVLAATRLGLRRPASVRTPPGLKIARQDAPPPRRPS
jgi:GT2 family glycosyltransferase